MSIGRKFFKYVSQNIFGMLGISCYVVADTFFISKFAGADGITVLNLVLPCSVSIRFRFYDGRWLSDKIQDIKGKGR